MSYDTARRFDSCVLKHLMSVTPMPVELNELALQAWALYHAQLSVVYPPSNTWSYVDSRIRALCDKGVITRLISGPSDGIAVASFVFVPRMFHAGVKKCQRQKP